LDEVRCPSRGQIDNEVVAGWEREDGAVDEQSIVADGHSFFLLKFEHKVLVCFCGT
jgi:hypothetical protein